MIEDQDEHPMHDEVWGAYNTPELRLRLIAHKCKWHEKLWMNIKLILRKVFKYDRLD